LRWLFQCIFLVGRLPFAEKRTLRCTIAVADLNSTNLISPQLIVPVCHQWPCDGIATSRHKPLHIIAAD
jgi:hypothetical protein